MMRGWRRASTVHVYNMSGSSGRSGRISPSTIKQAVNGAVSSVLSKLHALGSSDDESDFQIQNPPQNRKRSV